MQRKYQGKKVWAKGGLTVYLWGSGGGLVGLNGTHQVDGETVSATFERNHPLIVRRIVRLQEKYPATINIGAHTRKPPVVDPFPFHTEVETKTPLLVVLAEPRNRIFATQYFTEFIDSWDLERDLSLISPEEAGRKWSSHYRRVVANGEVEVGMTKEMVAWVAGWPDQRGTAEEILRRDEWAYTEEWGTISDYARFKNGRLTEWFVPSLP